MLERDDWYEEPPEPVEGLVVHFRAWGLPSG